MTAAEAWKKLTGSIGRANRRAKGTELLTRMIFFWIWHNIETKEERTEFGRFINER